MVEWEAGGFDNDCELGSDTFSADEIQEIVDNERKAQAMLKDMQRELSISKRAFTSIELEHASLKQQKEELETLRDDLLNQLKVCFDRFTISLLF